ncbi:uncharacterized protein LOC110774005 [Prunus avium]|uniref:Uncharacterized protein LOC110774005 n=1 Tax=Prunus avium TaxID=42229 RepID=A0A6P5U4U5_PRUAV|nr:uncharacterized protein LOC110774005 [Prunus avium]
MIQLIWNCQGLGTALTVQILRGMIHSHNPSVVFLMETKQNCHRMNQLRMRLGYQQGFNVDPIGLAGGLSLWWKPNVSVQIISASKNLIDTAILGDQTGIQMRCSYFYGPPYREEKESFWFGVSNLGVDVSVPWVCVGDFNEMIWHHEKLGGAPWCNSRVRYLRNFLNDHELIDLGHVGQNFTWARVDDGVISIQERLDRALVNTNWMDFWPNSRVVHMPKVGSDHCPLIFECVPPSNCARRLFKFELAWAENPECVEIVSGGWREGRGRSLRSRILCLNDGDRNTKFFHTSTTIRRNRNRITRILGDDGTLYEKQEDVERVFRDYFLKLFASDGSRTWNGVLDCIHPIVDDDWNRDLCRPIEYDEVKDAVVQLGSLKAPGPDGFPGLFYQKFWEEVKDVIVGTAMSYSESWEAVHDFNHTNIAIIPKVRDPELPSQYRPISLCNNAYKILSKILANRLKVVLPHLISHQQNAFIPGRQIQDNILVAHEVFHYLRLKRRGKVGELGLKLDMEKAYDRVEWDFLEATMKKLGFRNCWINMVMRCVTSVSFSVVINGKPGRSFVPSRGLRQGDPLSPYLFILISEVLSRNVEDAVRRGCLHGVRLCRSGPTISHLLFADDSLFFIQATTQNCSVLKKIVDDYCLASGQKLNTDKSSLYFSPNVTDSLAGEICFTLGMSSTLDPGSYLGLPSIWGRSKTAALNFIVDRIQKRVQGWKSQLLNPAGKEVLIKAVALAVPTYPMSCFRFPATTCKQFNGILSNFWWSNGDTKAHIHWKRWELLCLSKDKGGLGFRDLENFNLSLLAKQCWRIWHNPDAFWVCVLRAKYFPDGDFLKARRGPCPSWAWASLLDGRKIMSDGAIWQIGNGLKVKIWSDNWLHHNSILRPKPIITDSGSIPTFVNELIDRDLRDWNLAGISNVIEPSVAKLIRAIPLCNLTREDSLIWPWNKDGTFSVRSGYHWAMDNLVAVCTVPDHHSHQIDKKLWNTIWSMKVLPKIKLFFWRAMTNSLPTLKNLFHRRARTSPGCTLCNSGDESAEHAILLCPWSACVWFGIPLNYCVNVQSVTSLDRWLLGVTDFLDLCEGRKKVTLALVGITCWEIWKERCSALFESRSPCPHSVIRRVISLWGELCPSPGVTASSTPPVSPPHALWRAPPLPYVKVNVDGAWKKESLQGGMGCCLRDSEGRMLAGMSKATLRNSAVEVEAEAVLEGLILAKEKNCQKIILESDSMDVVSCMRNENLRGNWRIIPLILEIRRLSSWFTSVKWEWVSRQANQAAHAAAALSNMRVRTMRWASQPPPSLVQVLAKDGLPCPPSI